jgi:hypothetical protein
MKMLDKNWLTSGLLDVEYKKYVLLAYLQEAKAHFDATKLYPFLSDLVFHYQNLLSVKENKEWMTRQFPKSISEADFENLTFSYRQLVQEDELMQFIEELIEYALPQIQNRVEEGKGIYEWVEENTEITPVGVSPLYRQTGYFFVWQTTGSETGVYRYQVSIFENASEKYRSLQTVFVETFTRTLSHTFESKKLELIRRHHELPNPATFLITCRLLCPLEETLLPVAKRLLVRQVS